jgi:hypothetical protein
MPNIVGIPVIETLARAIVAPAGASIRPAQSTMWAMYDDLLCTLNVSAGAAGVGDTLDVTLETLNPDGLVIVIMTFTQILGNGSFPATQVKTAQKSPTVQWFDRMQARVTRAGGTAAFTYTLILQGS